MRKFNYYYPSLGTSWMLVLALLAGAVVFGIILEVLKLALPSALWSSQTMAYILTMLTPLAIINMASCKAYRSSPVTGVLPVNINAPDFGRFNPWAFFAVISLTMLSFIVLIEPLSATVPMSDRWKAVFETAFINSSLPDMVLSACILAPLCEEFLCRGIILRGILVNTASPRKAILWSSFIFAFIHLNPWQAIPAFLFGILFGWIYYRTGSLWATIFLHCLNNSFSTLLSRLVEDTAVDTTLKDILPSTEYAVIYCTSAVLFVAGIFVLQKKMSHISRI